ncbi:helicase associated domain-containing protein [Sinomonas sp. P47F7]|uniref:helicase associated domain-containing protein n=1 Tax=Sinomonas sp. P47F7 TaxID=3410987 RepID=UPI003BF4C33D
MPPWPEVDEAVELMEQLRILCGVPQRACARPVPLLAPQPHRRHPPVCPRTQADSLPGVTFRRQLAHLLGFSRAYARMPSTSRRAPLEERKLGMWLYRQRRRHAAGKTTRAEAAMLAAGLGPAWAAAPSGPTGGATHEARDAGRRTPEEGKWARGSVRGYAANGLSAASPTTSSAGTCARPG